MIEIALYGLATFWFCAFIYKCIQNNDLKEKNFELQDENSDLIRRNDKLDDYLDKARAEAVKANHKLMKLEYTEKVYQVIRKNNGVIYGNFRNKDNAEKFINGNINYFIKECQIAD